MKKNVFQQIIEDFIQKDLDFVFPRDLSLPTDIPKIVSLLGPRRAGKTFVLYSLISELRKSLPNDQLVYINFEDDRLFPLKLEHLDDLVNAYYELFPQNKDKMVYFFLDEVQEVQNWEKFVRRLFDQEKCRIYITGSSSKLLSRELSTTLRGRTLPFEVFPLSFQEFLQFKKITPDKHSSKGKAIIKNALRQYLSQGGFPELVFLPEDFHDSTINEYMDLMIYRDLTERFGIRNTHFLKYLLKYLFQNMANPIQVNNIFNDVKYQGYQVSKNTVYDYIGYLEEAFVVFRVPILSRSIKKQAINPSKVYGIDPAFKKVISISKDTGRVFENAVFLELRRQQQEVFYYKEKQEVDFIINEKIINACFDLSNPSTRRRELEGLNEAMDFLGAKESYLLTWDEMEDVSSNGRSVLIRPLWWWLLEET